MSKENYVTDVGYTYGYYDEINPLKFKLNCLLQCIKPPKIQQACELGYGYGMSVNIHASASDVKWWGTDFNNSHATFAKNMAEISQNNASLYADSFEEFLNRSDLPDFDFIAFHGIYSWVGEKNRDLLMEFINKKLKVGGGVYASYNVFPGFCDLLPFRGLLKNFSNHLAPKGKNSITKLGLAFDFFEKLVNANAGFINSNPALKERVENFKTKDRAYLVHEFMNDSWDIMDFVEISESFSSKAKVDFVGSSNLYSLFENLAYSPEQKEILNSIDNVFFKEYTRDLMHNILFRKDYWIKGFQKISVYEAENLMKSLRVILICPRNNVNFHPKLPFGSVNLPEDFYGALLDVLSDYQPKSIGEIQEQISDKFKNLRTIIEGVIILGLMQVVREAQEEEVIKECLDKSHRLNTEILNIVQNGTQIYSLASPVTGGGIGIGRLDQVFLHIFSKGKKLKKKDYVSQAWELLKVRGEKLSKDGKLLEGEQDNLKELEVQAGEFENKLEIFKNLKFFQTPEK